MAQLEQTGAFSAWEEAARKEWACIHAKFYVSLPKRSMHPTQVDRRQVKSIPQEVLPRQTPVIDVKAAERATLGTEFHAIGASQPKKRSNIVMKRIHGLNDNENSRAAPIFEYKLYYRAQEESNIDEDVDDNDMMDSDSVSADDNTKNNDEASLVHTLVRENNLDEYKNGKRIQIHNWHQTNTFQDPDEAEFVLNNRIESINEAATVDRINVVVEEYYQWFQKLQWNRKKD